MKRLVLSAFALALCAAPADAGFLFGFRRQAVVVNVAQPVVAVQAQAVVAQPVVKVRAVRAPVVKVRVR